MATHSSILAWENPMDRGAWRATVRGVPKSWTRLSNSLSIRSLMLYHFEGDLLKLYKHQGMFITISFLLWWLLSFLFKYLFTYLAAPGLNCSMWDLVPQPGIKPGSPALGACSLLQS